MKKRNDLRWDNCVFRYMVGAVAYEGKSVPIWPLHCKYGCQEKCGAWDADKFHYMREGNREDWRKGHRKFKRLCRELVNGYGMKVGVS